jgi:hypothetical protein
MTIRIQQLSMNPIAAGGIRPGTQSNSFKDTFVRANNADIGTQWGQMYVATTSAAACSSSINANLLRFTESAAGSTRGMVWPLALSWMTQAVVNQFAETTVSAVPATFGVELAVVMRPQLSAALVNVGFYCLIWTGGVTTLKIQKAIWNGVNAAPTFTTLLDTGSTSVVGDVLRITARNSAGTWTLTATKNGTTIGSTTDNTIVQGMPGLEIALAGIETLDIAEFAAGTA